MSPWLAAFLVASGLDIATTAIGLARGGREVNPIARWLIARSNPWAAMIELKLAALVVALIANQAAVYAVLTLLTVSAVVWNLNQLVAPSPRRKSRSKPRSAPPQAVGGR